MASIDIEKLRSINFGGRQRNMSRAVATRDDTGRITTIQIDHPDGSQEGVVRPRATRGTVHSDEVTVKVDG